jgi:hypothetical protein
MGIHSTISTTYTPPNHKSALSQPLVIQHHLSKELSHQRYTGPFSRSRLELLIGPFRSSPLGTVPKSGPNEFRIIQDLSFPRNNPALFSVNSEINPLDFPCDWGTFTQIAEIVRKAPPGTQAATMDVDAAFRCCPIRPAQQPHFIIQWDDLFYIDHNAPFGAVSSGGVFGRLADAMTAIIRYYTGDECRNWVDDFVIFRTTQLSSTPAIFPTPHYNFDIQLLHDIAEPLGWPWKASKTHPFASSFQYLGFIWDLETKFVRIPDNKCTKYRAKISAWLDARNHTLKNVESLLGTLVHCSLAIPKGRSHLPSLSHFASSFRGKSSFIRHSPNATTRQDVTWWLDILSTTTCGSSIQSPPPLSTIEFWVDASTSFGIGVVLGHEWEAWRLLPGWDTNPQHRIGWAEMVAVECGILFAIHRRFTDTHFILRSDNMGVIGALEGGKSRNAEQNLVLRRITEILKIHALWITPRYTPSAENIADFPSRGIPPPNIPRAADTFSLPASLKPFLLPRPVLDNLSHTNK